MIHGHHSLARKPDVMEADSLAGLVRMGNRLGILPDYTNR